MTLCDWAGSGPWPIGATGRGLHRTAGAPSYRHGDSAAGAIAVKSHYDLQWRQLGQPVTPLKGGDRGASFWRPVRLQQ
jgi:hypothetical protein